MPSTTSRKRRYQRLFRREVDDFVRGMCGGFLFGIPLLYTMEVWWVGSSVSPGQLIGVLLTTILITYLLSRTAGFRKTQASREREAIMDAVEAIALGTLCAALMLIMLRQITLDTRFSEALGKIIFESVPFSLGVALANQLLGESDTEPADDKDSPTRSDRFFPKNNLDETIADFGATLIGALIVAFSIAPTDEVTLLVAVVDGPWLVVTVLASVVLSYCIVFQANFTRQGQRRLQKGLFQHPFSETIFCYLVSLFAAGVMLAFFSRFNPSATIDLALHQILVLGLPAAIGGAAGRLAL